MCQKDATKEYQMKRRFTEEQIIKILDDHRNGKTGMEKQVKN